MKEPSKHNEGLSLVGTHPPFSAYSLSNTNHDKRSNSYNSSPAKRQAKANDVEERQREEPSHRNAFGSCHSLAEQNRTESTNLNQKIQNT